MSEVVEVLTDESQESTAPATEATADAPATQSSDEATWKKRLAGKDQALTAAQRERDAVKAERDDLAKWKAEKEQANLTEIEKLQQERDRLTSEVGAAKAEALAAKLSRQYPLAAEILGDDLSKFDEVRVAEIDGRLAKEKAAESEPEPRVDPNSPRRPLARPVVDDLTTAKQALVAAGNPYFSDF